jgi:hypothetical protein
MIRFKDINNEEVLVYFPDEFIYGEYTEADCNNTRDARVIYKITELMPMLRWKILKHSNMTRISTYKILGSTSISIKFFLLDLYYDITSGDPAEVQAFSRNVTKLYFKLQSYYDFNIIESGTIFKYVDDEYLNMLKNKNESNFKYFFPYD